MENVWIQLYRFGLKEKAKSFFTITHVTCMFHFITKCNIGVKWVTFLLLQHCTLGKILIDLQVWPCIMEKVCKIYAKIDQKFIENVNSSLCWKNCAVNYAYATLSTTARFRFCGIVSHYWKSSLKFFQKVPQ